MFIPPRVAPAKSAPRPASPTSDRATAKSATAMKWFVALMGAALIITACLGLYIAFNYPSRHRGFIVALTLGLLVPAISMVL